MNILRRLPLSRLLLLCGVVVAVGIGATALAAGGRHGPDAAPQATRRRHPRRAVGAEGQWRERTYPVHRPSARRREPGELRQRRSGPARLQPAASRAPRVACGSARTGAHAWNCSLKRATRRSSTTGTARPSTTPPTNTLYRYTPPAEERATPTPGIGDSTPARNRPRALGFARPQRPAPRNPTVAEIEEGHRAREQARRHLRRHAHRRGGTGRLHGEGLATRKRRADRRRRALLGCHQRRAAARRDLLDDQLLAGDRTGRHRISYGPVESSTLDFTPPRREDRRSHAPASTSPGASGLLPRSGEKPHVSTSGKGLGAIALLESPVKAGAKESTPIRARRAAEGEHQRHQRQRAAHTARHALDLRARRRALPARRLGHTQRRSRLSREASSVSDAEAQPVKARGLVKRYKDVLAVDHIDLNVQSRRRVRLPWPQRRGQDDDPAHGARL